MEPPQKSFTITVPPIACSFPWKMHPDSLKLKQLSDAWLVESCRNMRAACKSQRAASFFSPAHLVDSALHFLANLFFANAPSTDLLLPIVKLMSWYFMLDNFLDDPSELGTDPAQAKRVVDRVVAVFKLPGAEADVAETTVECKPTTRDSHPEEDHDFICILMDTAKEWWEKLCLYMTPSQRSRFRALFVDYVHSNLAEVCIRARPHDQPSLQTYMQVRRVSVGWYPLAVVTECCLGVEYDREVLTNPLIILLQQNVCESILLVNDIISFGKEYMQGDLFNIVFVLCFGKLLSKGPNSCGDVATGQALLSKEMIQEAVEEVSEMIKERDRECVRIMEEIRRSPLLMSKPHMEAYIQSLGHFMGGNLYWHLVSARYGLASPTDHNHIQTLDLHVAHHIQLYFPN